MPSVKIAESRHADVLKSRPGRGETGCEPACCENNN